jgi:glutaminyl-peptide cyclotransferase
VALVVAAVLFPTIVGIALAFMLGGGAETATPSPTPAATATPIATPAAKVDRFDSGRAFAEIERQVALGERPAGSAASRKLARRIRRTIPNGRFEKVPGGLRNVHGRVKGKGKPILIAAHYDTKEMPGFVGANDAAGGTAAVMELARHFRAHPPGGDLRFAFFDGEECPVESSDFYSCGLRGSRHHAKRFARRYRAVIVLDFVADKDLAIPYEPGSDRELWDRLRTAARQVGAEEAFPDATQGEVLDDHTPFARRGVPVIDLIDFDFPCWHQPCDDMTAVSERSLDMAGETIAQLVRTLARRP